MIFFARNVIDSLYELVNPEKLFRMEDVYYTGIVPILSPVNIRLVNMKELFHWNKWVDISDITKPATKGNPNFYGMSSNFPKSWRRMLWYFVFNNTKIKYF